MWFEELIGFKEVNPKQVRGNIEIVDNKLVSKVNNREFIFGRLETPSLEELRNDPALSLKDYHAQIKVSEVVGDIQAIHQEPSNNSAVIQVASQFNLLEMMSPERIPEDGVGIYQYDATQGPACAIACGAGTIYRNYFVDVDGQSGQTASRQIDCLRDIGNELENDRYNHWEMKNGYALASREGLKSINNRIRALSENDYEDLKGKLRVGVQWDSEVTISNNGNLITQVYCSALPVAYSRVEKELWTDFAKMILEATYEATLYLALKNYQRANNNRVYLTLIGGGAFGNDKEWIMSAIGKSIRKFSKTPLDIQIVSYRRPDPDLKRFLESIKM